MKKNKIFIGLAVGIGVYLLWNLKRKKSSGVVEQVKETVKQTVQPSSKPSSKMVYRGIVKHSAPAGVNTYLYGFQSLMSITRGKAEYSDIFATSSRLKATQTDNFFLRDSKGNDYTIIGVNNSGVYIKGNKKADFPIGSQFEIRKIA